MTLADKQADRRRSDRRQHILVLSSTFPRWQGDPTPPFVAELSEGLSEEFRVTVLAPAAPGAMAQERWGQLDVHRYRYSWPSQTQQLASGAILPNLKANRWLALQIPPFVLGQIISAELIVRSVQIDAIHAHWALPQGLVATVVGRLHSIPVLTTCHGADLYGLRSRSARVLKSWALRNSSAVSVVSESLGREAMALGVDAGKLHTIPMGVATDRFREAAVRRPRFGEASKLLFVGRLVEKKGVTDLIRAMVPLCRRRPDVELTIVGDGPERGAAEALVSALDLSDRVRFHGALPHDALPDIYAAADIFVAPSVVAADGDTEGLGLVLIEAMAAGCAVVGTNVGGISDVVVHDVNGLLVDQRAPKQLAEAISRLLSERETRARLVGRGIESSARFDAAVTSEEYRAVFRRLLARA